MDKRKMLALLGIPVAHTEMWVKLQDEVLTPTPSTNEILLYGPILDSMSSGFAREFFGLEAVSAESVKMQLDAIKGDVVMRVNSPGGDAWESSAIHSFLVERRNAGDQVAIKVDGLAASGASFIMCAGDPIQIAPIGQVMIHAPAGVAFGDGDQLVKMGQLLQRSAKQVATVYASKMKTGEAEVLALLMEETWYTAEDAIKAGLADSVLEVDARESLSGIETQARTQRLQMLAAGMD